MSGKKVSKKSNIPDRQTIRERIRAVDRRYWLPLCCQCGEPLSCRVAEYLALLEDGMDSASALNSMEIRALCTRQEMMKPLYMNYNWNRVGDGYKGKVFTLKIGGIDLEESDEEESNIVDFVANVPEDISIPTDNPDPNYVSVKGFNVRGSLGTTFRCVA